MCSQLVVNSEKEILIVILYVENERNRSILYIYFKLESDYINALF